MKHKPFLHQIPPPSKQGDTDEISAPQIALWASFNAFYNFICGTNVCFPLFYYSSWFLPKYNEGDIHTYPSPLKCVLALMPQIPQRFFIFSFFNCYFSRSKWMKQFSCLHFLFCGWKFPSTLLYFSKTFSICWTEKKLSWIMMQEL